MRTLDHPDETAPKPHWRWLRKVWSSIVVLIAVGLPGMAYSADPVASGTQDYGQVGIGDCRLTPEDLEHSEDLIGQVLWSTWGNQVKFLAFGVVSSKRVLVGDEAIGRSYRLDPASLRTCELTEEEKQAAWDRTRKLRAAGLPQLPVKQLMSEGRPAGLYKLTKSNTPKICKPMLEALNEPWPWSLRKEGLTHRGFLEPWREALLGNRYSVEWHEYERDKSPYSARTVVDVDNDGDHDAVYRGVHNVSNNQFMYLRYKESLPSSDEIIMPKVRRTEVQERDLEIVLPWSYKASHHYDDQLPYYHFTSTPLLQDVLLFEGKTLVLIGLKVDNNPVPLLLFEYRGENSEPDLQCEFEMTAFWIDPAGLGWEDPANIE